MRHDGDDHGDHCGHGGHLRRKVPHVEGGLGVGAGLRGRGGGHPGDKVTPKPLKHKFSTNYKLSNIVLQDDTHCDLVV